MQDLPAALQHDRATGSSLALDLSSPLNPRAVNLREEVPLMAFPAHAYRSAEEAEAYAALGDA